MELIVSGNSFFIETNLSSIFDCTFDCSSFCIDCSFGI